MTKMYKYYLLSFVTLVGNQANAMDAPRCSAERMAWVNQRRTQIEHWQEWGALTDEQIQCNSERERAERANRPAPASEPCPHCVPRRRR